MQLISCVRMQKRQSTKAKTTLSCPTGIDENKAPVPSLMAVSAVHHHLIEKRKRMQIDIVVESAEPREVMHFALLFGYGASIINPYLSFALSTDL